MKRLLPAIGLALLVGSGSALASTHSDFTKSYPLQTLKTYAFKDQRRISRDPLANNTIWAGNVQTAIRHDLSEHGLVEATSGNPDFYIAYYVGLRDRYDMRYVDYGMPFFHRGFRGGWWGWPRDYDAWAVPYTQSTLIIDVIDAHTNQLVWRGHDEDTLNMDHPDKTLSKAVNNVIDRFSHDTKHSGPA